MPIARMQKVRIFGLRRQRRQILDLLQDLSLMQVEEVKGEGSLLDREVNYDSVISEFEFAISFLEPYAKKDGGILDSFATSKKEVSFSEVKEKVSETVRLKLAKKCRSLEAQFLNLEELTKNLVREKELLEFWVKLKCPLNELTKSKYVTYLTGTIFPHDVPALEEALKDFAAELEVIETTKLGAYLVVAVENSAKEEVGRILVEKGFLTFGLPVSNRAPAEEIEKIDRSLIEEEERKKDLRAQAHELAKKRFDLMLAHDFFLQKKAAQSAEKKLTLTPYTFAVQGWIKKRGFDFLKKRLSALFPESVVVEIKPEPGEEPPVAIENLSSIKPFEAVTGIYGLPGYRDVDPTPLLATFFIIFFGLCLGDAGYGITLTLVAYIFYKKVGPTSSARKLLKLLAYGGITTFIAGAITGGWFGVDPGAFPAFLKPAQDFLLSIRVIDPVKNPIGMLVLALVFGIVQIIFGIFISFYIKIRDGRYLDAVLDDLLWVYFLLSLVLLGVQKTGQMFVSNNLGYFVLGGAAALVLTQGRKQKNPIAKLGSGVLSLYKTVGYLSDVLSYSRLLALGLATSIIAMVINMVAMMTKDSVPVLGYIIMILLLIGGHIFNLAVNVLGAFIHSSRLQFVEFFSKFLEGGGAEFKPLKRESKFVDITN